MWSPRSQTGPSGWPSSAFRHRRSRSNSPSEPRTGDTGACRASVRAEVPAPPHLLVPVVLGAGWRAQDSMRESAKIGRGTVGHRRPVLRAEHDRPQDRFGARELTAERAPTDINGRHKTAPDRPRSSSPQLAEGDRARACRGPWCIRAVVVGIVCRWRRRVNGMSSALPDVRYGPQPSCW
jgi:hypothetical protein